jgi:ankyrin repeat protein
VARKRATIFDAVVSGDPARVKRYLTRNPDALDDRDEDGLSPVMRAQYEGKPEIVELLLDRGAAVGLHEAAALGRTDDLGRLVGRSSKRANGFSEDGFAPLHLAAYFGHEESAELLLDRGADIEARSRNRRLRAVTPLHSAVAGRRNDVARLLLDRGADPNAEQPGGWTPLHQAAASGNLELCKALVAYGAERMAMADDRSRPLDFAIEQRHYEIVDFLKSGRVTRIRPRVSGGSTASRR